MDCEELETVQFKFASIIGGLCGKPKVLSQFAVWLDLRLAEYKLKGAISLDCSGCKPDPNWLQGLKPDQSSRKDSLASAATVEKGRPREITPFSTDIQGSGDLGSISSPAVIVKNEESDEQICAEQQVYPMQLHPHYSPDGESSGGNSLQDSHSVVSKRPHPERRQYHHTRVKKLRGMSALGTPDEHSESDITPVNESLISLINSSTDEVTVIDDDIDNGDDIVNIQSQPYNSFSCDRVPGLSMSPSASEGLLQNVDFSQAHGDRIQLEPSRSISSGTIKAIKQHTKDRPVNKQLTTTSWNDYRRSRLRNLDKRSPKSVRNIVAAVGNFERWLWRLNSEESAPELRQIFEIPPEELDRYLVVFFQEIHKPQGGNFHPESFRSLRSRLETYLNDNNYPSSIVHSPKFTRSRMAFKERLKKLEEDLKRLVTTASSDYDSSSGLLIKFNADTEINTGSEPG